jgi:hypothetical protein
MFLSGTILITLLLASAFSCIQGQSKEKWQRVYTGEENIIDVNVFSSRLESDHILRVDFRTIVSKPQDLAAGSGGSKYKSLIETIQFKLNENRYRLYETTWFDANGGQLRAYAATTEDWRVLKAGGVMERLFNSARALPPFGSWKVVGYKFAQQGPASKQDPNLEELMGTLVRLQPDRAEVGGKACSSVAYEDRQASNEELDRELGVRLESIGMNAEHAETTKVRCDGSGWAPPQSLIIKVKEGEMLMLWNGVFLVLKKEREWTRDILPPLKRARG